MNQYARVALEAVQICEGTNPIESWDIAAKSIIKSEQSRKKGCPKSTFLGMCEADLIKGIEPNKYLQSPSHNKAYAIKAIELLKTDESLKSDKSMLWKLCTDSDKNPSSQIEVIVALFNAGYIK